MQKIILEGKKINKSFHSGEKKNHVLKDISLSVQAGEYLSIMGPSGSGKSTLLYAISGMDNVDSGEVQINGKQVVGLSEKDAASVRLEEMGFIFQQPSFLKQLNILDNIVLPAFQLKKKNREDIYARAKSLMEACGIGYLADRPINKVSGGELQRAAICRALINSPQIIFGDEPTGALNSKSSEEIIQLLKKIREDGCTVILVTHDPKVATSSNRVLFLKDGEIASDLKLEGLLEEEKRDLVLAKMKELDI